MEELLDQLKEQIDELIDNKNFAKLKQLLNELNPVDIAALIGDLPDKELPIVFRLLSKENAADTFVEMDSDSQELLINSFTDAELKAVFDEMFMDDTVDVIEEMPANVVKRIINQSDPDDRRLINEILQYPKDSAGTLMTVEYVSLKTNWTVKECFDRIRRDAVDKETIYNCYVTDMSRKLIGTVSVKTLLLHPYETLIGDIMETNVIAVNTRADKEDVAALFTKYGLSALPVVDSEDRIVGIITVDDAMDVLQDETTEDVHKMAAIAPVKLPYLEQSIWQIWVSRIPWLLILMVSATFTALIINANEEKLRLLSPLLFACIPMLMGTGGNAGSQASITVIRAIALKEAEPRDVFRVLWKELRVAVCLAITVAAGCFVKLLLIDNAIFGYDYNWLMSLAVAMSLLLTIVAAKIIGCLLPMLAVKLKLDPAVVASPFITTIVDALSLLVYVQIASLILAG